jgi:hypothetical protein
VKGRVNPNGVGITFPRKRLVKSCTRRLRGNAGQQCRPAALPTRPTAASEQIQLDAVRAVLTGLR